MSQGKYLDNNCSPNKRIRVIGKGQSTETSQYESVRQSTRDELEQGSTYGNHRP